MKKKHSSRPTVAAKSARDTSAHRQSRRKFLYLGAGAATVAGVAGIAAYQAGWFAAPAPNSFPSAAPRPASGHLTPVTLTATAENAVRAADEMLTHYARALQNPSTLIHAVRGLGKSFTLSDGSSAVAHLCSRYAADKEVNGKRLVHFQRDAEVHENSFLKTFLEAGVRLDQPITTLANQRFTLRDAGEHARLLFRCEASDLYKFDDRQFRYDPVSTQTHGRGELVHEHLPWGLIAFAQLLPPAQAQWTNAYGERIELSAILDRALLEYETICALGQAALLSGQAAPADYREKIKTYSCFGLHSVYAFLVCWRHGYTANNVPQRLTQLLDFVTYRLQAETQASNREYDEANAKGAQQGQSTPAQALTAFKLRARVKLLGHAFEAINYAKLHQLMTFTANQEKRIQGGEQALYDGIVQLRALDWAGLSRLLGDKFLSDVIIALGHATRGLKLRTTANPDTLAATQVISKKFIG